MNHRFNDAARLVFLVFLGFSPCLGCVQTDSLGIAGRNDGAMVAWSDESPVPAPGTGGAVETGGDVGMGGVADPDGAVTGSGSGHSGGTAGGAGDAASVGSEGVVLSPSVFSGCWQIQQSNGNDGSIELRANGNSVEGQSKWQTHSNGSIVGTVSGSNLEFTIVYPEGVIGYYSATMDSSGMGLMGGVTHSSTGDTASWSAVRTDCMSSNDAMVVDDATVFFCDFNDNLVDQVSEKSGILVGGSLAPSLFGSGMRIDHEAAAKSIYRFSVSPALNLSVGTMEALIYANSETADYTHIIDKSWLYGVTAYKGRIAVHFGGGWWYSAVQLPLQTWAYVCASFDGAIIRLYLDGALVASSEYAGRSGDPSYDLGIGNAAAETHDVPFHGIIDEVRISSSIRDPKEIAATWAKIQSRMR